MDRSTPFYLLANTAEQNANGEFVEKGAPRMVYGDIQSISRAEFFAAGEEGLRAELQIRMFAPDYQGEKIARLEENGAWYQFAIYRTYRAKNEILELYLADRVGISAVDVPDPNAGAVE